MKYTCTFRTAIITSFSALLLSLDTVNASSPQTTYTNRAFGFQIDVPTGWASAPLLGRMVWHVASNGETNTPDCSVIVTSDWSFGALTTDEYLDAQSEENFTKLLKLNLTAVNIGVWEPNSDLGGQRALQIIYSGNLDGSKLTSMVLQTTRGDSLFTFTCNAEVHIFPLIYKDLLDIADSFVFITK